MKSNVQPEKNCIYDFEVLSWKEELEDKDFAWSEMLCG